MKRLGLIGAGAWARRYVDRIGRRADCRITAAARASLAKGETVTGVAQTESWQALVEQAARGELDGVIAATTPMHQADVAAMCATQGVPLLVEKPLGLSLAGVERVRECFEAGQRKAPLVVDYIHLWAAAFVGLKARIADEPGGVGKVLAITAEGFNRGPLRDYSSLYDYGSHDLAMLIDLLGTNAEFRLHEASCTPGGGDYALYDTQFDLGGVPVRMCVGNGGDHKARRFAVALQGGRSLVYDDVLPHPHKLMEDGVPLAIDVSGPLDAVLTDFVLQIGEWQAGRFAAERARAVLDLSVRVNGILDELAARANAGTA